MSWWFALGGRLSLLAVLALAATPARAETMEVRFARNVGLGYLPVYIMQAQKLVEAQARAVGLGDVAATYRTVPGPGPINDLLISGNIDFGIAGIQGMIIAWDKTRGHIGIKGLAPIGTNPAYLNTDDGAVHSLRDFTGRDRIAVPTVKVSSQAYALEYAGEQLYGAEHFDHFDHLTVSLGHPDALAALLSGSGGITAHFATQPYALVELENPKVHTVTTDEQIYKQRLTSTAIWTTTRFHNANPRLCGAVLAALEQADSFIAAHPDAAARIFLAIDGGHYELPLIEKAITGLSYATTPQGIRVQAEFMKQVGAIRAAPVQWRDLFFGEMRGRSGS